MLITVREAAARLRVAPADIVRLAREGKIRSRLEAFQRLVYLEDIIRLETERLERADGKSRALVSRSSKTRRPARSQPPRPQPKQLPGYLTVADVSSILQIHPRTVRKYIHCGKLTAQKTGGFWYIRERSAANLANTKLKWFLNTKQRWLQTRDAARILRVHPKTIIAAIQSGTLEACRVGYQYRINPQSVYRLLGKQSKLIPVHEAARMLGLKCSAVRDLVYQGKLKAHRIFSRIYIEPKSLRRFAAQRAAEEAEHREAQSQGCVRLPEAARMLKCDYAYLRRVVRQKNLPTRRIGRCRYLAPEAVELLRQRLQAKKTKTEA